MMYTDLAGSCLILLYVFACAFQDLRTKSIHILTFLLMAAAETVWYLFHLSLLDNGNPLQLFSGILIGVFLLFLSRITNGQTGLGDAFYFMEIGAALGFSFTLSVFFLAAFTAGVFSLVLIADGFIRSVPMKGKAIPFLPFTVIPVVWILLRCGYLKSLLAF